MKCFLSVLVSTALSILSHWTSQLLNCTWSSLRKSLTSQLFACWRHLIGAYVCLFVYHWIITKAQAPPMSPGLLVHDKKEVLGTWEGSGLGCMKPPLKRKLKCSSYDEVAVYFNFSCVACAKSTTIVLVSR